MTIIHDEWIAKCGSDTFRATLVNECTNLKPTINRALAILSQIHKKEITMKEPEHVDSIMMLIEQLQEQENVRQHWAVTYGVCEAKGKKSAKRKAEEVSP